MDPSSRLIPKCELSYYLYPDVRNEPSPVEPAANQDAPNQQVRKKRKLEENTETVFQKTLSYFKYRDPEVYAIKHYNNGVAEKYEGLWLPESGLPHKYGAMKYVNGTYTGEWKDGKRHGEGTFIYESKEDDQGERRNLYREYQGSWVENKKHGYGTMLYVDGTVYEGEWSNDRKQDQGTIKYPDGSRYSGEWKKGKKHSWGVFTDPHGYQYDEYWDYGKQLYSIPKMKN